MNFWTKAVKQILDKHYFIGIDPRHVEAYMSLDHSTFGHLSAKQLESLALDCVKDVQASGKKAAEQLAQSFGL